MSARPTREQVDAALATIAERHAALVDYPAETLATEVRALRAELQGEQLGGSYDRAMIEGERDDLRAEVERLRKVERDILAEVHDLMTGRGAGRRAATAALRARLAVLVGGAS